MDLRPYCASTTETPPGVCPFNKPEDIAAALYNPAPGPLSNPTYSLPAHKPIQTYVVGFALDQVDHDNNPATPTKDCTTLTPAEIDASSTTSLCGNPANASNAPLQACCTLQRIAIAGGTERAYFSSDKQSLRSQLDSIVSATMPATSRTQPVASGGGGGTDSQGGGMTFFSGFVPRSGAAWQGRLERQRIICTDPSSPGVPKAQPVDETKGDNFERNLAISGNPDARRIYTMLGGATVSDPLKPMSTIRPLIGSDKDGAGMYGGRSFAGYARYFVDNLPTGASLIPTASCINQNAQVLTAAACQKQYLEWWAGYNNGQSTVLSRCVGAKDCRLLGDIMHSTPAVVDRPVSSIRDESYTRFTYQQRTRPKVLYTSTNDGMLHAFKVGSNDQADEGNAAKQVLTKVNNELWTFVPPATLPVLYTLYPHNHQVLLDGVPTVMNVVAQPAAQATDPPTVFERSQLAAQQGSAVWRTVLVQSFGKIRPGYFALDVTNPVPDSSNPDDVNKGGPRMLWQLTGDKTDKNLFGSGGGTPTITTLLFDPLGSTNVREIPVAILPGGPGGTVDNSIAGGCPAGGRTFTDVTLDASYPPRSKVRCYTYPNNDLGARSLTIVRLDTGEIVRTFRQSKTEVATELQGRVTEVGIDSPIVGQPTAFPGFTGEVADRIFVGDADGRLWRLNVASPKPADWTMKLFMDTYPTSLPPAPSPAPARVFYAEGQPITSAPVVSVDADNNLILNVATGDQDSLGASNTTYNYVYSLKEKVNAARTGFETKVNWYYELTGGERVVGPMVLFNSQLFFGTYLAGASTDVCAMGTSRIWGMDYLTPLDPSSLPKGGKTVITPSAYTIPQVIKEFASTVAFGPQLMQQPSCASEVDTLLGDGLVGFGHQVSLTNIQTGAFQLVFQTGSNTSGSAVSGGSIGVQTINLPPPPALSNVSAWASIVE
jgi:type IV pilus assembly protein PilY1